MFGAKLSGAKLSRCQIVQVPNCPLLLFWCKIVRFIILLPNCPVPNWSTIRLGRFWNSNCRKLHLRIWKCSSPSLAPRTILRPLTAWTQRPVQSSYSFHSNAWLWMLCFHILKLYHMKTSLTITIRNCSRVTTMVVFPLMNYEVEIWLKIQRGWGRKYLPMNVSILLPASICNRIQDKHTRITIEIDQSNTILEMLLKKNTSFSDLDFESAKNFETCWHGVYRIFNLKGHFNRLLWPTEALFERFRNFPCIPHDALLSKINKLFKKCLNWPRRPVKVDSIV